MYDRIHVVYSTVMGKRQDVGAEFGRQDDVQPAAGSFEPRHLLQDFNASSIGA